jgi:polar amino acid transport system permease protein
VAHRGVKPALDSPTPGAAVYRVVPVRHYWRWVGAAVALVVLASLLYSFWSNPRLDRGVVGDYLFAPLTLRGLMVTIELTVIAMAVGVALGLLVAVMRQSANPVLVALAWLYVWFFRATPALVQLIFWGFLGALYPEVAIGIPFTDVVFAEGDTNRLVGAFVASVLGLGLAEAAYMAEIIRGGILSVDPGQTEAARSLGMSGAQTMRRIVLPQAMRVIVPPMGNEAITVVKLTALVSVISGNDLLTNLQQAYAQNFQVMPLLIVATLWYLGLVSLLSVGQYFLEARYGRGIAPTRVRPWRSG